MARPTGSCTTECPGTGDMVIEPPKNKNFTEVIIMWIKTEDVFGVSVDGEIYHLDCVNLDDIEEQDIIFRNANMDDMIAFCDECGKRIN